MNIDRRILCASAAVFVAAPLFAQEPQRITMPFRDGSAPRKLIVNIMLGSVTVKGYNGKDAIIEYTTRGGPGPRRRPEPPPPQGMHRIGPSRGVEVTENNNTIRVNNGMFSTSADLSIQVPPETSVEVKTFGGGNVSIENISGEIEANNMNGQVNITDVSGSVVAHSMNGKVQVTLNKVAPDKNMSFSTMNGDVDVTLPADTKANFKMRADNGEIYTDFDVKVDSQSSATPPPANAPPPATANSGLRDQARALERFARAARRDGGATYGTVNGGGPEIQFTTFNGRILIHKK
ncbi:MAG TPA: DUF4097 family beta strand repeat-containing protein [Bryobacteraceae bacterium]|nr:DUF4097 family beta strand repeat-containing protein [Bryobacteraceae bacterium]